MAKSLFSNNNTDITDKYRIRNEEALRKERAQSIDKQIEEFSHAQGGEDWANEVIAFQQTLNEQSVEVVHLLINLPLYSQLKKDARNELDKIELSKRNARIAAEAAQKAKEQAEADKIDGEIISLSKAKRNESWISDVERLYDVVKNYDSKKQIRPKENGLIENLLNETKLVRDALSENEQAERFAKSKATSARWANEVITYDKTIDERLKQYMPCIDRFNEALKRARDILFAEAEKEQEELDAIDGKTVALSKESRDESWAQTVNAHKKVVADLPPAKRERLKNSALLDKLCAEAKLVEAAIVVNADMLKLLKANTKTASWAKKIIDMDKNVDKKLLPYVSCLSEFNEAKAKADEIIKAEKERKAKERKIAEQKAAEEKKQADLREKERIAKKAIETDLLRKKLKNIKHGQTITFGSYAPSGSSEKKPIEWIVASRGERTVILVSKYVLDTCKVIEEKKCYLLKDLANNFSEQQKHREFYWGNSAVRDWLNGEFYNEAFSDAEKDFINVETNKSYYQPHPNGESWASEAVTTEKVYLPAFQEIGWSRVLKKHLKCKYVKGADLKQAWTKKGLFGGRKAVYLLRDVCTEQVGYGNRYTAYKIAVILYNGKRGTCRLNNKSIATKGQKEYEEALFELKQTLDRCGIRPMITINHKH